MGPSDVLSSVVNNTCAEEFGRANAQQYWFPY